MPINHSEDEAHLIPNSAEHGIEPSEQFDTSINDVAAEGIHRRNCHRLYLSHALSTWNSRVFEFGAFLFLASIFPDTLLPASIYALARSAAAAICSPWLGGHIDRSDRLGIVRLSICMPPNLRTCKYKSDPIQSASAYQWRFLVAASYSCCTDHISKTPFLAKQFPYYFFHC